MTYRRTIFRVFLVAMLGGTIGAALRSRSSVSSPNAFQPFLAVYVTEITSETGEHVYDDSYLIAARADGTSVKIARGETPQADLGTAKGIWDVTRGEFVEVRDLLRVKTTMPLGRYSRPYEWTGSTCTSAPSGEDRKMLSYRAARLRGMR